MATESQYQLPESQDVNRSYLGTILTCACPRCRQSHLFEDRNPYHLKNTMKMYKECPTCGQPTEIEVGFYTGAAYVSYALTVALAVAVFVAWYVLIGFSMSDLDDFRIYWCLLTTVSIILLATPYVMRLSRAIWLSFFVKYDKDWRINDIKDYERINPIGMEK
ncbi:MAG: DUF983 domain-containing protein [Chitinophagaceae bacterium]